MQLRTISSSILFPIVFITFQEYVIIPDAIARPPSRKSCWFELRVNRSQIKILKIKCRHEYTHHVGNVIGSKAVCSECTDYNQSGSLYTIQILSDESLRFFEFLNNYIQQNCKYCTYYRSCNPRRYYLA